MTEHPTPAPPDTLSGAALTNAEARIRDELLEFEHTPEAGPLWMRLCLCLAAQGHREDEAFMACQHASEGDDGDLAIRALLQMVRLDLSGGRTEELLERAQQRLLIDAGPVAVVDLAAALVAHGRPAQAAELLEGVVDETPEPAPRSAELAGERRARAVAALRLAELRSAVDEADEKIDELLLDAVDANDPSVTPVAALRLAQRREQRDGQGCAGDEMYRTAWGYDHPRVTPLAGRRLVEIYESRGQIEWARDVLEQLAVRGDEQTALWAKEHFAVLSGQLPKREPADPDIAAHHGSRSGTCKPLGPARQLNTLVIGAGSGAQRLLNEVNHKRVKIVGLVDDRVRGPIGRVKVLGRIHELPAILAKHKPDQVLLAIPTAAPELRYHVALCCAAARVWLRVLPNPFELLTDRDYVRQLRAPRVEETYGDTPIAVDPSAGTAVRGKSVLIVGAGGTIGAELARQVVVARPRHLALLDRSEPSLVELERELKDERRFRWIFPVVADATNRDEMRAAIQTHEPDIVFIAAGINHAHVAEKNIAHAARVNILGPWITAEEAIAKGADRVILVSADNAARRRGSFDRTKALAERAILGLPADDTCVSVIRLRSVSGSPGSVFDRFSRQVSYGGPLTLTTEDAKRRFLNVHEAAQWILRVAAIAEHDRVYAVDSGVPVRIRELAERVIRLHGLEPNVDIRVATKGPRHLEKANDDLWGAEEYASKTTSYAEVSCAHGEEWVVEHLRPRLLEMEQRTYTPPETIERFLQEMLKPPVRSAPVSPDGYSDDYQTFT